MSPRIGFIGILVSGYACICAQVKNEQTRTGKKEKKMEKNVKEGDCGLTASSLEGKLQFMFVMERGYAKCLTEGMYKVCLVMKGEGLVLKVSVGDEGLARACFQSKEQKCR